MQTLIKISNFFLHTLVCLVFLSLAACQKQTETADSSTTSQKNTALEFAAADIATAQMGTLAQQTPFTGSIRAIEQTTIKAQTNATALAVYANVGDQVKSGQRLAALNNQDNTARLAQSKANLASAKAQADLNKTILIRKQRLYEQGFIAKLELEQSQLEYRAQQENVKAQQANVDIATKAAQDANISSPIAGYITQRQVEVGQTVSPGQTLFEIINPKKLEIKALLAASDAQQLSIGQTINFRIQGNNENLSATVSRISPVADANNRHIEFFARPNNTANLSIGAFIEGELLQQNTQQGLLIPLRTIQNLEQNPFVWVIREHKLKKVAIQVLRIDHKQQRALIDGLIPDEKISLVKIMAKDEGRQVKIE